MKINYTFPSKVIISTSSDLETKSFIKSFIEFAWLDHDVPSQLRTIKESIKLTLEMFPKDFKLEELVEKIFTKGLLNQDKIGVVPIFINMVVSKDLGTNPGYKIEIDKFYYEQDGHDIKTILNKIVNNIKK